MPRAEGETVSDCSADMVRVSMSTAEEEDMGCWEGGGTEEYIAIVGFDHGQLQLWVVRGRQVLTVSSAPL